MQDKIAKLTHGEGLRGYFAKRGWWTPNQIRDHLIESWGALFGIGGDMTEAIQLFKTQAIAEQEARKLRGMARCPCCYGYHEQAGNVDSLCEICEAGTAAYRYDNKLQPA